MKRGPMLLPIRLWTGLVFGLIIAVPALTATSLFATAAWWQQHTKESAVVATKRLLGAGVGHWGDPAWQVGARRTLAALGVDTLLFSPDGSQVFATAPALPRGQVGWHVWEIEKACIGGAPSRGSCGTAALFVSVLSETTVVAGSLAAGLLILLPTLAGVAWFLRRTVVRPLTAMSSAAERIGDGRLDIHLPSSRIRELAAVAVALETMSAGLQAALDRQAVLEQERRLFIGAVAHDLRTPLFTLRAYLGGLGDGLATTPEKAERYIAVCQEKAEALEHRVAGLFAFARIEYLEQEPRRESLDLGVLLRQLVDDLGMRTAAGGIALVADDPGVPCPLLGDRDLLRRAVENLLENAIHFTPAGGMIQVSWGMEGSQLMFQVSDSGPGVAAEDLPHLFEPLFRAESSRNRQYGGSGLGLTIARRILLAHGGNLTATNRATGGAVFTGVLPPQP